MTSAKDEQSMVSATDKPDVTSAENRERWPEVQVERTGTFVADSEYAFELFYEGPVGPGATYSAWPREGVLAGSNQFSVLFWAEGQPYTTLYISINQIDLSAGESRESIQERFQLDAQGRENVERIYPVSGPDIGFFFSVTEYIPRMRLGVFAARVAATVPKYRDTIKLRHVLTGRTLHSHPFNYGHPGTSGQQQVTGYDVLDDNDLWIIKAEHGQPEDLKSHEPILNGDIIRLQHVLTGRNLHSHPGFPSPVTGQQEVTCYGDNGLGDTNDNWRVEIEGVEPGGIWKYPQRLRLIHVNTGYALHSHAGYSHPEWTLGQQEVTCYSGRSDDDWWALSAIGR